MHYTIHIDTQWLSFGKKLAFDYSQQQAHNLKKVPVLCDARDIVNMAIRCWSLQLCVCDNMPTTYGVLFSSVL